MPGNSFDKKAETEVKLMLKALIGRNIYDNEGFYPVYLKTDAVFQRALDTLKTM